jgi:hypothetical protein
MIASNSTEIFTLLGVFLGLSGFILQFEVSLEVLAEGILTNSEHGIYDRACAVCTGLHRSLNWSAYYSAFVGSLGAWKPRVAFRIAFGIR